MRGRTPYAGKIALAALLFGALNLASWWGTVSPALALGRVPDDRWWKFIWKLLLIFLVLTAAFLALSAVL